VVVGLKGSASRPSSLTHLGESWCSGDTVELRGSPESSDYQAGVETQSVARLIASGTVKTSEIGQSAAKLLPGASSLQAAPHGEGSTTRWRWAALFPVWLKIESRLTRDGALG